MLTPPLLLLRRIKVPRVLAVVIVVGIAFAIIFGLGWLLSREVTQLAADLPTYRERCRRRSALRESTQARPFFSRPARSSPTSRTSSFSHDTGTPAPEVGTEADRPDDKPIKVEVLEPGRSAQLYQRIAGTLLPPLATAGIVLLFVVFILLQREDLRDRLIRLFGSPTCSARPRP